MNYANSANLLMIMNQLHSQFTGILENELDERIRRSFQWESVYYFYGVLIIIKAVIPVDDISAVKYIQDWNAQLQACFVA